MSDRLKDYLETLSDYDNEPLSEKITKIVKEVGELASVVTSLKGRNVNTLIDRDNILEECVDVILNVQSIIQSTNSTEEEIEKIMVARILKRGGELRREKSAGISPIPYNIRIVIELQEGQDTGHLQMRRDELNAKMHTIQHHPKQHIMFSFWHLGSNRTAYNNLLETTYVFKQLGYDIIRQKIETVTWHDFAPKNPLERLRENCYFEAHINVACSTEMRDLATLIAGENDAFLSECVFRKMDSEYCIIKYTMISPNEHEALFRKHVEQFRNDLITHNFDVSHADINLSIYDTMISHDVNWLEE